MMCCVLNNNEDALNTHPGQPTKYKKEYAVKLLEYFGEPPYFQNEIGKKEANDFPTLAGFAISIGVHRETILNWTKEHPEFFDAYKRAKDYQENFLVVNAMKGLIHPSFSIFTAKNILNWREKQEVEMNENHVITFLPEDLESRIEQLKNR